MWGRVNGIMTSWDDELMRWWVDEMMSWRNDGVNEIMTSWVGHLNSNKKNQKGKYKKVEKKKIKRGRRECSNFYSSCPISNTSLNISWIGKESGLCHMNIFHNRSDPIVQLITVPKMEGLSLLGSSSVHNCSKLWWSFLPQKCIRRLFEHQLSMESSTSGACIPQLD